MTQCKIDGCEARVNARGWCGNHYRRWRLYGDPLGCSPRVRWLHPGERFVRLVVQEFVGMSHDGQRTYRCLCDCGNTTVVLAKCLKRGTTRSCGCLHVERAAQMNRSHGLSKHPLYTCWYKMHQRCEDPRCEDYPNYGGRGICVDPRWHDVRRFVADLHPKPSPSHLLDRIDNDGPYSPENCRWATPKESSDNKRAHGVGMRRIWRKRAINAVAETIANHSEAPATTIGTEELAVQIVDAVFACRASWREARATR